MKGALRRKETPVLFEEDCDLIEQKFGWTFLLTPHLKDLDYLKYIFNTIGKQPEILDLVQATNKNDK